MPRTAPTNTANRTVIKSGLLRDSLIPSVKTNNPKGSKLFSKFLISFFINSRVKIPVKSTPKEFINVPMPGIINY